MMAVAMEEVEVMMVVYRRPLVEDINSVCPVQYSRKRFFYDALMNRYNKRKNAKHYLPVGLPRVSDSELQSLASKWLVKGSISDDGRFIPVSPDTLPPALVRDYYFPHPPVDLADDSFALPDAPTKPPIATKTVLYNFSRPLTKIIDSKRNKIQIIPKKTEPEDIDVVNMSKRLSKLFPEIDQEVTEQINDEKNEIDMEN